MESASLSKYLININKQQTYLKHHFYFKLNQCWSKWRPGQSWVVVSLMYFTFWKWVRCDFTKGNCSNWYYVPYLWQQNPTPSSFFLLRRKPNYNNTKNTTTTTTKTNDNDNNNAIKKYTKTSVVDRTDVGVVSWRQNWVISHYLISDFGLSEFVCLGREDWGPAASESFASVLHLLPLSFSLCLQFGSACLSQPASTRCTAVCVQKHSRVHGPLCPASRLTVSRNEISQQRE